MPEVGIEPTLPEGNGIVGIRNPTCLAAGSNEVDGSGPREAGRALGRVGVGLQYPAGPESDGCTWPRRPRELKADRVIGKMGAAGRIQRMTMVTAEPPRTT